METKRVYIDNDFAKTKAFKDYMMIYGKDHNHSEKVINLFIHSLVQESFRIKVPALALYDKDKLVSGISYKTIRPDKSQELYLLITHQYTIPEYRHTFAVGRFILNFIDLAQELTGNKRIYFYKTIDTEFYLKHQKYFTSIAEI